MNHRLIRVWQRHAAKSRPLSHFLNSYIWFAVLLCFLAPGLSFLMFDYGDLGAGFDWLVPSLVGLSFVYSVTCIGTYNVLRQRVLTRILNQSEVIELSTSDPLLLTLDVKGVAEHVGLFAPNVRFYADIAAESAFPVTTGVDDYGEVMLPLGFFKLVHSRPGLATAILVHELAHIRQRECDRWPIIRAFAICTVWYLVGATSLYVGVFGFAWLFGWDLGSHFFDAAGIRLLFVLAVVLTIRAVRHGSEYLADAASVAIAGLPATLDAIRLTSASWNPVGLITHPLRESRLGACRRFAMTGHVRGQNLTKPHSVGVIAIAMIGFTVTSLSIPNFSYAARSSRLQTVISNLSQIESAREQWAMDLGKTPSDRPSVDEIVPAYMKSWPTGPIPGEYEPGLLSDEPTFRGKTADQWRDDPRGL